MWIVITISFSTFFILVGVLTYLIFYYKKEKMKLSKCVEEKVKKDDKI